MATKLYELKFIIPFGPPMLLISSINLFEITKEFVRLKREGFNVIKTEKEAEECIQ